MALFEALAELVGAAIIAAAPADVEIPAEVAQQSGAFAHWLRTNGQGAVLDTIVDALAREIWVGGETRNLSQHALEHHARALGGVILANRPQAAHLAQAIERARTGVTGQSAGSEPAARRVAVDIFARARGKGAIAAASLKDDIALFMIDRTYAHLLDEPGVLTALTPSLKGFAAAHGEPKPAAAAEPGGIASLGLSLPLAARLAELGGPPMLADLRERFGIGEKAMRRLLQLLDHQGVHGEDVAARLDELAAWLGEIKAQLQKPSNEDAEVRRLKVRAATALAEGDFEAAAEALQQVRREVREGRRRIEERLADEVAGLRSQMQEESRAAARLAELALTSQNYAQAAELFSEAAMALPSADRETSWRLNLQRAEALLKKGEQTPEPQALVEAVTAFSQVVKSAAESANPKGLGQASLGLGSALTLVGERESGTARLKDAAAAFRKAIHLLGRDGETRSAATAQLRLGRVLVLTGERDKAPAVLREAAQAFREALLSIPADRQPTDFVTAQTGLGNALLGLEEREGGLDLLVEAAGAYTAALPHISRSANAVLWADAQMSLGLALLGLGEQPGGDKKLEGSVQAFNAALEVTTRMAAPSKWALLQLNLGNALAGLGNLDRESTARLQQAIAAYNAALEEFRRDSEPLKWAIAQMNLGTALIRLGERQDKRRNWLAAAGALVPALEVFEAQGATDYADVTRRGLRRFHESWDTLIAPPSQQPSSGTAAGGTSASLTRLTKAG